MGLFGNQAAQGGLPVDSVQQLRSQGRSDHEIIDLLSRQGYSSIDIYNALNQADQTPSQPMPGPTPAAQPPAQFAEQNPQTQPPVSDESYGQPNQNPQDPWANQDTWQPTVVESAPGPSQPPPSYEQPPQTPTQPQQPFQPQSQPEPVRSQPSEEQRAPVFSGPAVNLGSEQIDQIDQIAEAIIDEKWTQLKQYIEKIVDWKGKVESRIIAIEQNQKNLNEQIIGLQKSLIDKVQTYDRHITDVGTEIKAMEKVFQKIIPSLTDNVNELSNVVHRMKDER